MAYPNHKPTAYLSPLASNDPYDGSTAGRSRYSQDYSAHATSPRPSPAEPRGSHEMFSPGGLSPDALQTKCSFLPASDQQVPGRNYFSSNQARKLLAKFTARFILSFAACAGTIAAFKIYQDKKVLTKIEERVFNALNIGVSLILGMNIISSFKAMASVMRWKILASGKFTLREVDLILSLSSFQCVLELMRISGRPLLRLACFAWILLGIAAQIGVALLGLSQNMESDGIGQYIEGRVNITDMTNFYPDSRRVQPSYSVQQSTAHLHGDMATYFPEGVSGTPEYEDYTLLERSPDENSTQWKYYFRERFYIENPKPGGLAARRTNRSATATPRCEYHPIVGGQYAAPDDGEVIISVGGKNVTIDWMRDGGSGATTYVNPNGLTPSAEICGPRCNRIYIFQWVDKTWDPPSETGSFFNCTITISQVENANPLQPFHSMADETAEVAAGAIGLDGYVDESDRQFVRYAGGSTWGSRLNDSIYLAELLVGKYAIGVIAAYDGYGPSVEAVGLHWKPGVRLSVNWFNVSLTLGCILGVQLVCGMFVLYYANSVFCKDDSNLSTALLLRPLVERLGNSGSTSTGLEISQAFTRPVRYGVRSDLSTGQPIHRLDVGEDLGKLLKFPEGRYN